MGTVLFPPKIYLFSCLIVMAKTSNVILNRSGHPCFFLNLEGKAFIFSQLSMILTVSFLSLPLLGYSRVAERFHHEWMLKLLKFFSYHD